jgi:hypothetical protein
MHPTRPLACAVSIVLLGLSACGGGGGGGASGSTVPSTTTTTSTTTSNRPADPGWVQGVYQAPAAFADRCAAPRTGTDPTTGRPYADAPGSVAWENHWLRAWSNAYYLWYRELPDLNPANYATTTAYFDLLKTSATTASGAGKDRFHFTYVTSDWVALSTSGVAVGYGAEWALLSSGLAGGRGRPASRRRDRHRRRRRPGQRQRHQQREHPERGRVPFECRPASLRLRDPGAVGTRPVVMIAGPITSTPVQNVRSFATAGGVVGYLLFNDHIATAERQLVDAFTQLQAASVADLVVDLRYNGGGLLDIASEVAYMVAGGGRTTGKAFERLAFNDKYPATNPITGASLAPTPFHASARGFSVSSGTPLPSLNLARVFVLTGAGTCSASESIINGLRGAGVEVIQIGSATCGKPYGFYPEDNCGTTYFSIQFAGVNEAGFGDYADGFWPQNASGTAQPRLPGCSIADDFTHELGDPLEGRLAAALAYRVSRGCPAASGDAPPALLSKTSGEGLPLTPPEVRMNRILGRRF